MRYKVKLNKTDLGYAIWCPALPGCWTLGKTEEEALANIKHVIQDYLAKLDQITENAVSRYIDVQ